MGYPYHTLVTPAILLDNPGITREEYVQLLDKVHTFSNYNFKRKARWTPASRYFDSCFHEGLEGLGKLLLLESSKKYIEFNQIKIDEYGLELFPPEYRVFEEGEGARKQKLYNVLVREKHILEQDKEVTEHSFHELKVGKVWEDVFEFSGNKGIVKKIITGEKVMDETGHYGQPGEKYKYHMIISPFHTKFRIEEFTSFEKMCESWPQFHPDFVFNWEQNKGRFSLDMFCDKGFAWEQKDKKFYLSEQTFNQITAGSNTNAECFGYTDLILTAEAVKNKAWKILSREGLEH